MQRQASVSCDDCLNSGEEVTGTTGHYNTSGVIVLVNYLRLGKHEEVYFVCFDAEASRNEYEM